MVVVVSFWKPFYGGLSFACPSILSVLSLPYRLQLMSTVMRIHIITDTGTIPFMKPTYLLHHLKVILNETFFNDFQFRVFLKKMYLAVLWICDSVFDADYGNCIHMSQKK